MASFVAGALGGAVVAGVAVAALATNGELEPRTRTLSVLREPSAELLTRPHHGAVATAQAVYARDADGVVNISSTGVSAPESSSEYLRGETGPRASTTGSGFEIDRNGDLLTNWHVVESAAKITVSLPGHSDTIDAQVVGKDPSDDLALLRVPTAGVSLHPLKLGNARTVQVGEAVLAIGSPFGYGGTLTNGIISALDRNIAAPNGAMIPGSIQTDAPISPGSSGGPLLNMNGEVIGINSQIVTTGSGGGVGIAFAIPINVAKAALLAGEGGGR